MSETEKQIAALQDKDSKVRIYAVWALERIGDPAAVPALTLALQDKSSKVRISAALALDQLKEKLKKSEE